MFGLREGLIDEYRRYSSSFVRIADPDLRSKFEAALDDESMWPHPMLALNPSFEPGGTIDDLTARGTLHPDTAHVFRTGKSEHDPQGRRLTLHRHQAEAVAAAQAGRNYLLTTGTGSGKSLAYIIPIVDHVLRTGSGQGVKAIVVYPMNALANSQMEELDKFLKHGPWAENQPVTYQRYTGQDRDEARDAILANPPDILLTNYSMLELILTRVYDRALREQFGNLRFLVLDELHTYRGRQGSDVAMLVRRVRQAAARAGRGSSPRLLFVGTSATLSSQGSPADRQARLAAVASELFGAEVAPDDVIGETLRRSTRAPAGVAGEQAGLIERVNNPGAAPTDPDGFKSDPLSAWIETVWGGRRRRAPGAGPAAVLDIASVEDLSLIAELPIIGRPVAVVSSVSNTVPRESLVACFGDLDVKSDLRAIREAALRRNSTELRTGRPITDPNDERDEFLHMLADDLAALDPTTESGPGWPPVGV